MKTRPFKGPSDFTCPIHKVNVKMKRRFVVDEDTGRSKSGGDYMACPSYVECKYYVSVFGKNGPMVANIEEESR